jgi:hypothetical protein
MLVSMTSANEQTTFTNWTDLELWMADNVPCYTRIGVRWNGFPIEVYRNELNYAVAVMEAQ